MTRINANISPARLIDQHLVAEYREIVRIPNAVRKIDVHVLSAKHIPSKFTLGTGHVIFFYDKIKYLHDRFKDICAEMRSRNFNVNMTDDMFIECLTHRPDQYGDIDVGDLEDGNVAVIERIVSNMSNMKRPPTIRGNRVNIDEYSDELYLTYGLFD